MSGRRIARRLREQGHEVRAADEERALDGRADADLLDLARAEGRILVTFNARDFARIVREWAEAGRSHAGCMILVGIDHSELGLILERIAAVLSSRPDQARWTDYTCFAGRAS